MSEHFETVERPAVGYKRGELSPPVKALIATLENGQAIRIRLNGRTKANIYSSFYTTVKRLLGPDVVVRTHQIDAEHHAYWLERK